MPREQLLGLAADIDRILTAGATTAAGSEKLQTRANTLREMAKKVPTIQPVVQSLDKLVQAPPKSAGPALLELMVMTRQIRSSLTNNGQTGNLELPKECGPWTSPAHVNEVHRELADLINQVNQDKTKLPPAIDLRIVTRMLELMESSSYHADSIAELFLPILGRAILPELTEKLNLKGKSIDSRRLTAICKIDPALGLGYCRKALQEGSKEILESTLELLPNLVSAQEIEDIALTFCDHKTSEVRQQAIRALASSTSDRGVEKLFEVLLSAKDYQIGNLVSETLSASKNPSTTNRLLKELDNQIKNLDAAQVHFEKVKKSRAKAAPAKPAPTKKGAKATPAPTLRELAEEELTKIRLTIEFITDALGKRRGGDEKKIADALVALLDHPNQDVVEYTVMALSYQEKPASEKVVPALLRLATATPNLDFEISVAFDDFDGEYFAPHAKAVFEVVNHPKSKSFTLCRESLILKFDKLFPGNEKEVFEVLKKLLKDKDQDTRERGMQILCDIGTPSIKLLKEFIQALQEKYYYINFDPDEISLKRIDPEGKKAIPELIKLLGHKEKPVKIRSLELLEHYGKLAASAIPAVEKLTVGKKENELISQAKDTLKAIQS